MVTVELEDLYIGTILTFCENLAELGCPRDSEPDMWFRELSYEDQRKVAEKMFDIEDRIAEVEDKCEKHVLKHLLACSCGAKNSHIVRQFSNISPSRWECYCNSCGVTEACGSTAEEAINNWNKKVESLTTHNGENNDTRKQD